jgi:hypothetical protein
MTYTYPQAASRGNEDERTFSDASLVTSESPCAIEDEAPGAALVTAAPTSYAAIEGESPTSDATLVPYEATTYFSPLEEESPTSCAAPMAVTTDGAPTCCAAPQTLPNPFYEVDAAFATAADMAPTSYAALETDVAAPTTYEAPTSNAAPLTPPNPCDKVDSAFAKAASTATTSSAAPHPPALVTYEAATSKAAPLTPTDYFANIFDDLNEAFPTH